MRDRSKTQELNALKVGTMEGEDLPLLFVRDGGVAKCDLNRSVLGCCRLRLANVFCQDSYPETNLTRKGTCTVPGMGWAGGRA